MIYIRARLRGRGFGGQVEGLGFSVEGSRFTTQRHQGLRGPSASDLHCDVVNTSWA